MKAYMGVYVKRISSKNLFTFFLSGAHAHAQKIFKKLFSQFFSKKIFKKNIYPRRPQACPTDRHRSNFLLLNSHSNITAKKILPNCSLKFLPRFLPILPRFLPRFLPGRKFLPKCWEGKDSGSSDFNIIITNLNFIH